MNPGRLAALTSLAVLASCFTACSSSVDVSFNLINPCQEDLFGTMGCQLIEVEVSALDPADPLYPGREVEGLGPLRGTCDIGDGQCSISDEELVGDGRVVDVRCYLSLETEAVARATSSALKFESGGGGAGGKTLNLLFGNVNGFVDTTVLDPGDDLGTCSKLGITRNQGRFGHTATLLDDGRVLIAGGVIRLGQGVTVYLDTAEIYDPLTGQHSVLLDSSGDAAKMTASRAFHTATRLRDGRVLIAGGVGRIDDVATALRSAEIFDPTRDIFVPSGDADSLSTPTDMGAPRAHHCATLLATGEALLTGGAVYTTGSLSTYLNTAKLFNPDSNAWSDVTANMSTARAFHQAVLLDPATTQGKVLVVGGENADGTLDSIDIYNPNDKGFFAGVNVSMSRARSRFCATRLQNGEVLVAGGTTTAGDFTPDSSVEIFSLMLEGKPYGGFKPDVINLEVGRMDHSCNLLETGNVVVAGGRLAGGVATSVGELVLIGSNTYTVSRLSDSLDPPRFQHTATQLESGWILLAGGLPNSDPNTMGEMQSQLFVPRPR
ncbi:MAG: hypothetical protein JXR96_28500 [Deltaproteobacteria bacterium]|nr:hypothetical protein [Deltaproteobacteria bacterium]